MEKILLDTNILVYFADQTDWAKHEKAQRVLKQARENPSGFIITLQNVREFGNVMTHKTKMPAGEINQYISLFEMAFADMAADDSETMQKATILNREHGVSFYGANLFHTAQREGATIVYTENLKDFEKIPGINVMNPLK